MTVLPGPAPSPVSAATVHLTCACGCVMPEAWGPRTVVSDGVRVEVCPDCNRTLRFKPDRIAGMPRSVMINPLNEDVAIADWGD